MAGALDPSTVCEVYQDLLGPRIAEVSGVQVIQSEDAYFILWWAKGLSGLDSTLQLTCNAV